MNKNVCVLLTASVSLLLWSGSKPLQSSAQNAKQTSGKSISETQVLAQTSGYKKWTRANAKPYREASYLAAMCAPAPPVMVKAEEANPHNDKYIAVYVNDIGKRALLHQEKPTYPVGTVIVKEKRTRPDSAMPELCTVMLKREAGYSPQNGNWQYFVTDGTGTRLENNGNAANCKSCHTKQKPVDYVFRHYLPDIAYRYLEHQAQESKPSKL